MTVVSTKEFNSNQDKYFEMALKEKVGIKRKKYMYYLLHKPIEIKYPEQQVLMPDENLSRAISAEELLERIHRDIHKKFIFRISPPPLYKPPPIFS